LLRENWGSKDRGQGLNTWPGTTATPSKKKEGIASGRLYCATFSSPWVPIRLTRPPECSGHCKSCSIDSPYWVLGYGGQRVTRATSISLGGIGPVYLWALTGFFWKGVPYKQLHWCSSRLLENERLNYLGVRRSMERKLENR